MRMAVEVVRRMTLAQLPADAAGAFVVASWQLVQLSCFLTFAASVNSAQSTVTYDNHYIRSAA